LFSLVLNKELGEALKKVKTMVFNGFEQMDTEIGKMKHGFNETLWECKETTNLITDTLTDNI
jgi:hypothetical protein